jgi:hypothetical protein
VRLSPLDTSATNWLILPAWMIDDECGAVVGERTGRETELLGENLYQRHFVHHKSHMTRCGIEPGPSILITLSINTCDRPGSSQVLAMEARA